MWPNFIFHAYPAVQGLQVDGLAAAVHFVKVLALNEEKLSLDKVVGLMRFFPCLEKLHVKVDIISRLILVTLQECWLDQLCF
jgi:hypothetical protein